MSTEYTSTELSKRERAIIEGIDLLTTAIMNMGATPRNLNELFFMRDAIEYFQRVAEDIPILANEIGVR